MAARQAEPDRGSRRRLRHGHRGARQVLRSAGRGSLLCAYRRSAYRQGPVAGRLARFHGGSVRIFRTGHADGQRFPPLHEGCTRNVGGLRGGDEHRRGRLSDRDLSHRLRRRDGACGIRHLAPADIATAARRRSVADGRACGASLARSQGGFRPSGLGAHRHGLQHRHAGHRRLYRLHAPIVRPEQVARGHFFVARRLVGMACHRLLSARAVGRRTCRRETAREPERAGAQLHRPHIARPLA